MSTSQRQAIITLIDKKDKDRSLLDNWRPISLLNTDVKILSKALAFRIKKVLPNIIHHNQSGYVEGRYIGETIRTIYDIMDFTKSEGTSGILAFLDFEKAFDSIEWNFIHRCLEVFGFGSDFIRWFSVLYKDISSCVCNNGVHSDYFILERGVRQGDPLSPYIFITAVELLSINIRTNSNIRGINIGETEIKVLQYADDTTGVLKDDCSLKSLLDVINSFERISGLKINISKSECMGIGVSCGRKGDFCGLKWPERPIKCLGVYLTYDYDEFIKMNYKQRLKKLENTVNWWKGRGLTLYGRAQIINSLLLPKLIFIATMFAVPEEVIKDVNRIVFKFLWRGQDRVVRTAMINSYENGGLRVLDFETLVKSVRLSWFKRLFAGENTGWKCYLNRLLKPYGGLFLLHCDYDPKDYNISNQFYAELIKFWAEFRNAFSDKDNKSSIIWNNKNIRIDGKPVFYKKFFEKNISLISQLGLSKNNLDSLEAVRQKTNISCNFLEWSGLRSAIPSHMRKDDGVSTITKLGFIHNDAFYDVSLAKSKQYYNLLIKLKATLPNTAKKLKDKFNIEYEDLSVVYLLPIKVCIETSLRDFQFKVLNYITCTNILLKKLGVVDSDICSFCNLSREEIEHMLFNCSVSQNFWNDFKWYWYCNTKEIIMLSLKDIIVGVFGNGNDFLNYCILVGKSVIYHCKRNKVKPSLQSFKLLLSKKYHTELYIAQKNNILHIFHKKWKFKPLTH